MISFRKYENDLNFIKNDSCHVAIVSMSNLPAFYFITDAYTIDEIKIICLDRATFDTLILTIETIDNLDGTYTHVYKGGDSLDICGLYYFEILSGIKTYYSELFSVEDFTDIQLPFTYDIGLPGSTYTDTRDSKTYETAIIGNRCWMTAPFRYLEGMTENVDYVEPFDISINPEYGLLYKYDTIKNANFLPLGWRLPTESDIYDLITTAGGMSVSGHLKLDSLWDAPNTGGDNSLGFNATPTGFFSGSIQQTGKKNCIYVDSEIYPNSYRVYTLNYDSASITKESKLKTDYVTIRLVRDVEYKEYYDRKDELHLPIKFSEILEIDKDTSTIVNRNVMPVFLFKTINETSGTVTINQVSWDGLTTYPVLVTIYTEVINGYRYYYTTEEDVELECGLFYFEVIDDDRVYYSNLLSITEIETQEKCTAFLVTEVVEDIVETETGATIILESCDDSPYVPTLEAAVDYDGVEFSDYDDEIFTIEI